MGRLTVNGLDALSDDFAALARLPDSVVEGILEAEADVILPAQRAEIEKQWKGPHSLGISSKSVKKGKVKKDRDGRSLTIYPQGTRKRGGRSTRNAEIAFINEYGKTNQPARPAIREANEENADQAVEDAADVLDRWIQKHV